VLESAQQAMTSRSINRGIFGLVFFAILREGFETVLLLGAATKVSGVFSYTGFFLGIVIAILV